MSKRRQLSLVPALVLALAVFQLAAQRPPEAPAAAAQRPRLVLFVSVDQMRFDYLTRFASQFTGGLRRVLDHGAVFTEARYRHACTETGPGHSVLLSGRSPRRRRRGPRHRPPRSRAWCCSSRSTRCVLTT